MTIDELKELLVLIPDNSPINRARRAEIRKLIVKLMQQAK